MVNSDVKKLCNHWSLENLDSHAFMNEKLHKLGFKHINVADMSFRVAPTVLQVPSTITAFILKKLFPFKSKKRENFYNLKASLYALLSGMQMTSFRYYIISTTK